MTIRMTFSLVDRSDMVLGDPRNPPLNEPRPKEAVDTEGFRSAGVTSGLTAPCGRGSLSAVHAGDNYEAGSTK